MKNNEANEDLLTYNEAAAYCRLRTGWVLRQAVLRRELQIVALSRRTKRFRRGELDRWMNSKKTKLIPRL